MKLLLTFTLVIAIAYAHIEEDHSHHPDCQVPACPRDDHRNRSYPLDCTKYVSCSTGRPIVEKCPSGYKYHQQQRICEISIGGAGQGCLPCWIKHPEGL
ncbi:peritrophin-1-like [Cotesia typhae]|uniref:peritrophin-1-like n=1 Tax=Cotesia typhae TaxID=2053667 RepID=UPI003D690C9A